jgi:hypothetical protein
MTFDSTPEVENKLNMLKDWLIKLHRENVVKINHSVMELVCQIPHPKRLRSPMNTPLIPP